MNTANSTSSRQHNRRIEERRNHCRRVIFYPFGSDEWVHEISESYLLWPKDDRRHQERRYDSRRHIERRTLLKNHRHRLRQLALNGYIRRQGLTTEEKNMLDGLI
jgi:hypothetical protein